MTTQLRLLVSKSHSGHLAKSRLSVEMILEGDEFDAENLGAIRVQ